MLNIGGNGPLTWLDDTVGDGFDALRYLSRSSSDASLNGQDWKEPGGKLSSKRWYPSAQILGDGRIFVASGSLNGLDPSKPANNNPTYEILSRDGISEGNSIKMAILEGNQPYFMYPFMHLLKDGNIYIFTAKASQIFSASSNTVVKDMPSLAGLFRTYPNTGGSVLLPLSSADGWESKIMICGGGAYQVSHSLSLSPFLLITWKGHHFSHRCVLWSDFSRGSQSQLGHGFHARGPCLGGRTPASRWKGFVD